MYSLVWALSLNRVAWSGHTPPGGPLESYKSSSSMKRASLQDKARCQVSDPSRVKKAPKCRHQLTTVVSSASRVKWHPWEEETGVARQKP